MTYNEKLANRIRKALAHLSEVEEKKMFGGLAFMVNKKMCITVGKDRIMCRINPSIHNELIATKNCSTVKMKGRGYKGYVHIDQNDIITKKELDYWIKLALDYNKIVSASAKNKHINPGNSVTYLAASPDILLMILFFIKFLSTTEIVINLCIKILICYIPCHL